MSVIAKAARQVTLEFQDWRDLPHVGDPLREDISCLGVAGDHIFIACDETASIEHLAATGSADFARHQHVNLAEFFKLPDGPGGEMDIEGLAVDSGYLWITGSHSLKRDKPERDEHGAAYSLQRMLEIDRDPNRYFLGRVPLHGKDDATALKQRSGERRAAAIKLKKNKSKLLGWLEDDEHLAPFLSIPSKENGFDIEGLAVRGTRAWLGLRGPVLRGHGVILELDLKQPSPRRLKPRKIDGGRRYRKHVLGTRGLGVRDLCFDGNDMLVLIGTAMASDGPCHILRWKNALFDTRSGVVDDARIEHVLELPYHMGADHPEGIDLLPSGRRSKELLVVYDSPSAQRVARNPARLKADIFRLPG